MNAFLRTAFLALGLSSAPAAVADCRLERACAEAELVALGHALDAGALPDGTVVLTIEEVLRGPPLTELRIEPASGPPRPGARHLLFLRRAARSGIDTTAPTWIAAVEPVAWPLSEPEQRELRRAVELELGPEQPQPRARTQAYLSQLGRGELMTCSAASTLAGCTECLRQVGDEDAERVLDLLESRRSGSAATAALVHLAARLARPNTAATLVDLVAAGASVEVVTAVKESLPLLHGDDAGAALMHALGRAPDAVLPDLLRLVGASRDERFLAEELHPRAASSQRAVRLAAIQACGDVGARASIPVLLPLLSHDDEETVSVATAALRRCGATPPPPTAAPDR